MKKHFTKRDLDFFRALLNQKRALATGDLDTLTDADRALLSSSGGDEADQGSDAFEQDFALSILENEANVVREIDNALVRIDDGTYGICLKSGVIIGRDRLEAIPWTRFSIDAQREEEASSSPRWD